MLKFNKTYDGWMDDWRSTKSFIPVCREHCVVLVENEEYLFRQTVGCFVSFDEDEVDTSGMMCPGELGDAPETNCSHAWDCVEDTYLQDIREELNHLRERNRT